MTKIEPGHLLHSINVELLGTNSPRRGKLWIGSFKSKFRVVSTVLRKIKDSPSRKLISFFRVRLFRRFTSTRSNCIFKRTAKSQNSFAFKVREFFYVSISLGLFQRCCYNYLEDSVAFLICSRPYQRIKFKLLKLT